MLIGGCAMEAPPEEDPGPGPAATPDAQEETDQGGETEKEPEPSFVEVKAPRRAEDDFQAGVAVIAYGDDRPENFQTKSRAALDRLAELHVNSVSLVFPIYQDDWQATEVRPDPDQTPSDRNIAVFIREAKMRGFTVLLRPTLDEGSLTPSGHWRGSIEPASRDAWFASYRRVLTRYARIAAREEADILAVGTELTSLQDDRERWRGLIRHIRGVFDGTITYATNWDAIAPAHRPTFIGALDFLSVDAFFPLDVGPEAGVQAVADAWTPWIRELRGLGPPLGEIVFTEVGIRAQRGAYSRPYVWEHGAAASPSTQRRYYAGTCRATAERIGGLHWWTVDIHHPTEASSIEDFSPLGKPAEREIARCYRGVS